MRAVEDDDQAPAACWLRAGGSPAWRAHAWTGLGSGHGPDPRPGHWHLDDKAAVDRFTGKTRWYWKAAEP